MSSDQPSSPKTTKPAEKAKKTTTAQRAGKFFIIGCILALTNYLLYTLLVLIVINNNDFLWLSSLISTSLTTILAYILHSRITWRERTPTKPGIINFFLWNALLALIVCPVLTWLFGFITPLYKFAFNICSAIHLPFSYEFVESTGIFVLVNIITMTLNYFFYDRLVFGKKENSPHEKSPK